jgi:alcohol dehydrogenase class IV
LSANPGNLLDYLEVIGAGRSLVRPSAAMVAVPMTAGTGSEVTRNAVIASPAHKVKVSLRSPFLLPRVAVVDPELTYSMLPALTASTGMDALTQVIEPYVSPTSNPMTESLCRDGIQRAGRSLVKACANGLDVSAREDMSLASLFGGLALANARLGAVHGLAGPIGGMFPAPHGAVCARLLPIVTQKNVAALMGDSTSSPVLERYMEIARLLTGDPAADAQAGIDWLHRVTRVLDIPSLAAYGIRSTDFPAIASQAMKSSSMKGNPVPLSENDLIEILSEACL